ncbi:MAG: LLM class flavin-dependent oxidoreductase [Acidimicrobiales bacterium]
MDIGWSVTSWIAGLDGDELIGAITERSVAAREAGFDSLHIGDRHGMAVPYAANFVLAGRLGTLWPRRFGVLVVSTLWNPVLLAEQIATVSASTRNLTIVVAMGDGDAHFGSVGVPVAERLALFVDGLAVTRALLDGETVSATVGPYQIKDAQVRLSGRGSIEWWVAASAPVGIRRAARIADGWLASAKLTPKQALEGLATYREATGGSGRAVLRREVYVAADDDDVARNAEPLVRAGHRGYAKEAILRGTVEPISEQVKFFADHGFDELLARSLVPEQQLALASIERFAEVLNG